MTGLEKLVKHIEDEALSSSSAIIAEAKKKADEIIKQAKTEGEAKSAEIIKQSQLNVKAALNRADSAALLQERRLLLDAKQQIIDNILVEAKEKLLKLPNSEYFDVIISMIKKYALNQTGKIAFLLSDKNRLPNNFEDRIKVALSEKGGAMLLIADRASNIDGGFVLIYGDVEENCSLDALFFAAKESLQDKVSNLLFG